MQENEHLFSSPVNTAADKGHFAVSFLPENTLHIYIYINKLKKSHASEVII